MLNALKGGFMSRILFLIPHPDDEVVAAATFIRRLPRGAHSIFGLYLTSGVPLSEHLWWWQRRGAAARLERRRQEARLVASALGIEIVGFSDWPSRRLKDHLDEAAAWIGAALDALAIDTIWVPAWEGGHQDHDVANFLASQVAKGRPVREFAEYNLGDGVPQWQRFAVPNGEETVIELTPEEAAWKRWLLHLYRSERAGLRQVRVDMESARPLPRYDYSRPPHAGLLSREKLYSFSRRFVRSRIDLEPVAEMHKRLNAYGERSPAMARAPAELHAV